MKLLILFLFPLLLSCGKIVNANESNNSVFQNISLMLFRNSKLTVSGTAVKGIVKNGIVVVNPLSAEGTCNTAKVLSSGTTDGNGDYSLTYFKTGSFACLTILGDPSGNTKMFDEKENADIALASSSSFKLVKIIDESKITNNNQKIIASPFSTMHSRRLQALMKQSGSTDMAAMNKKASKEVVIRFGLSSGLSSASARATTTSLNDKDYPELDDLAVDLKNPNDSLTAKNLAIMAGISYLANKTKAGTKTTPDDVASVMNAFATDFEDGIFDGKGSDGNAIKIGTGASQIIFSSTPLTTTLLPAIVSYIQEGGILSAGIPGASSATITATQLTSQTQFIDTATIISSTTATAGATWTARTLPSSQVWRSVTYANGVFVAVGNGTAVATSPDGITWTDRTMPSSALWWSVTYGNGVFVAVAGGTSLSTAAATSPDGITWTSRTLPNSLYWNSVTFGNGVFVAVATLNSVAATSPDGITWTARVLPSSTTWFSVSFGNGGFVAVSGGNAVSTIAATSPDGITWTARTLPVSTTWTPVTYGNGIFVIVAKNTNIAATSPDGITWTARTLPSSSPWVSLKYGNGIFVAVSGATVSSDVAATSPDGITWTARTLPSTSPWVSVTYANGIFVAVSGGTTVSTAAATSP
jgi:hypothetical protein